MDDSVIITKVNNGYIVQPEMAPSNLGVKPLNSEVYVFETFEALMTHLELVGMPLGDVKDGDESVDKDDHPF